MLTLLVLGCAPKSGEVSPLSAVPEDLREVFTRCDQGSAADCEALGHRLLEAGMPERARPFLETACLTGRSVAACAARASLDAERTTYLTEACVLGHSASCPEVTVARPNPRLGAAALERPAADAIQLTVLSCAAGVTDSCGWLQQVGWIPDGWTLTGAAAVGEPQSLVEQGAFGHSSMTVDLGAGISSLIGEETPDYIYFHTGLPLVVIRYSEHVAAFDLAAGALAPLSADMQQSLLEGEHDHLTAPPAEGETWAAFQADAHTHLAAAADGHRRAVLIPGSLMVLSTPDATAPASELTAWMAGFPDPESPIPEGVVTVTGRIVGADGWPRAQEQVSAFCGEPRESCRGHTSNTGVLTLQLTPPLGDNLWIGNCPAWDQRMPEPDAEGRIDLGVLVCGDAPE